MNIYWSFGLASLSGARRGICPSVKNKSAFNFFDLTTFKDLEKFVLWFFGRIEDTLISSLIFLTFITSDSSNYTTEITLTKGFKKRRIEFRWGKRMGRSYLQDMWQWIRIKIRIGTTHFFGSWGGKNKKLQVSNLWPSFSSNQYIQTTC